MYFLNMVVFFNRLDTDLSEAKLVTNIDSIFTCTWNVPNLTWSKETEEEETVSMSVPFEHGGKKLFRAELEMRKNPEQAYTVKFLSFCQGDTSCGDKWLERGACSVVRTCTKAYICEQGSMAWLRYGKMRKQWNSRRW